MFQAPGPGNKSPSLQPQVRGAAPGQELSDGTALSDGAADARPALGSLARGGRCAAPCPEARPRPRSRSAPRWDRSLLFSGSSLLGLSLTPTPGPPWVKQAVPFTPASSCREGIAQVPSASAHPVPHLPRRCRPTAGAPAPRPRDFVSDPSTSFCGRLGR